MTDKIPTLQDIEDSKDAMDDIQSFTYSIVDSFVDAKGTTRDTVTGRLKKMGYAVPVVYAGGIVFAANDNVKTVEEAGVIYAPLPASLPFTTSGTFVGDDDARFFVIQGITTSSLENREFDTLNEAVADVTLNPAGGQVVRLKGRLSGNRGAVTCDTVLQTAVTLNPYDTIACIGVPSIALKLRYTDQVSLLQLGAVEDAVGDGVEAGTTDDSAVVDYAATLGIKIVASDKCMISTSRKPAANSNFIGVLNRQISQFVIKPGVEVNNPFEVENVSSVRFNRLGFIGNSTATVPTAAGAIRFISTVALAVATKDLEVTECYFENFKQNYWIYSRNDSTFNMSNVHIDDNEFVSKTGNDIDPTSTGVPAVCIGFQGSSINKTGIVTKLSANRNKMDCSHMKSGINVWSGCHRGELVSNEINDCGKNGFDDKVNYGILMYTNRFLAGAPDYDYDPSGFDVHSNKIARPRDVGIYMQGLVESTVHNNNIFGQTSTADATLLKGALVTNGVHAVDIYSNTLHSNSFDLGLAQINFKPGREIVCNVYNNTCLSRVGSSVKIVPNAKAAGNQSGIKSTLNLTNNTIYGEIHLRVSDVVDNFELNITGGSIKESFGGIGFFLFNASTPTIVEGLWININGVDFADLSQDGINITVDYATVYISECKFDIATIKNKGLAIQNSKGVTWERNHFWASGAITAGDHCVNVTGAEHFSRDNTTKGIPLANKEIGFVAPTWAANDMDKVQTLRASEAGSVSSKYISQGYVYAGNVAAWVEERILTGN